MWYVSATWYLHRKLLGFPFQSEIRALPSWSPNSTYLHLDFICQQTNTKEIAGQSAKLYPEEHNSDNDTFLALWLGGYSQL